MRVLTVLGILLLSSAASAQLTVTFPNSTATSSFGPSSCTGQRTLTWTKAGVTGTGICEPLRFWLTAASSCSETAGSDDVQIGEVSQTNYSTQTTATLSFDLDDAPFPDGQSCGAENVEATFRVCASARNFDTLGSCGTSRLTVSTPPTLTYDSKPPDAPGISGVNPLDKQLRVNITVGSDAATTEVEYREKVEGSTTGEWILAKNKGSNTAPGVTIDNLANEKVYEIRAFALDTAENRSAASAIAEGTPVTTYGIFSRYLEDGGQEEGGCAAGAMTLMPGALAVLGMAALLRGRRR